MDDAAGDECILNHAALSQESREPATAALASRALRAGAT